MATYVCSQCGVIVSEERAKEMLAHGYEVLCEDCAEEIAEYAEVEEDFKMLQEKQAKAIGEREKIMAVEANIREAISDYASHIEDGYGQDIDRISDAFITRLARDSVKGKAKLRDMLRRHPQWNEELDAVVIKGEREYRPNWDKIRRTLNEMTAPLREECVGDNWEKWQDICGAKAWFYTPDDDTEKESFVEYLERVAPNVYHKGKKPSKILRGFLQALGIWSDTDREFQRKFAAIADEYSTKLEFTLFLSVNPGAFLTMSNPHYDTRTPIDPDTGHHKGMMVSCHSLTSNYEYRGGCSGYARDGVTMIAFVAANPKDHDSRNSRKTMRQIFCYEPDNGLLLQSRLYKTNASDDGDAYGGCHGTPPESKVLRNMVEGIIATCEDAPNLWRSFKYNDNEDRVKHYTGSGFTGYPDWQYSEFGAVSAIRKDKADSWHNFDIGTYGLCWECGDEASDNYGIFCDDCRYPDHGRCDNCGDRYDEDDLYTVYDEDGNAIEVCEYCRDEYYHYCECCGQWHPNDEMTYIESEDCDVCQSCLDRYYEYCEDCDQWYHEDRMNTAYDTMGNEIRVCDDCLYDHYVECEECGEYYHEDAVHTAYKDGEEIKVCESCRDWEYRECENCGEYNHKDDFVKVLDEDGNTVEVCRDCMDDYYMTCAICGDLHRIGDMTGVVCDHCIDVEMGVNDEQEIA